LKSGCRGFSLVEVVVALGILTLVFSATSILIVQTVNIAISAREKTQAILLAQKIMTEEIVKIEGDCNIPETTSQPISGTREEFRFFINHDRNINYGHGLEGANFIEITVNVKWDSRETFFDREQEITISQIVGT